MKEALPLDMDENVLMVVRNGDRWRYFASEIETWVMDWEKWTQAYADAGHPEASIDKSARGGVVILNEHSAERVLNTLATNQVSEQNLRQALRAQVPITGWQQVMHLFPSALIDFDSRKLYSLYSEPLGLEHYVPDGWSGVFGDFYKLVPVEHRYWIDGGNDYLRMAIGA